MEFENCRINIEWSRKSGRFDENSFYALNNAKRSREKSWERGKEVRSRSRSRFRTRRERRSPSYHAERSVSSVHSDDCPRDKVLK